MRRISVTALTAVALIAPPAVAQGRRQLSLEEALHLATAQSEVIRIAQAGVLRAQGQQIQARSQYLPQFNASLSYQRTLKSQFEALRNSSSAPQPGPDVPPPPPSDTTTYFTPCTRYLAPAGAAEAVRIVGLETYARCASGGGGFGAIDFQKVGFGAANQYQLGLTGSWTVYSGGRAQAQVASAAAGRRTADVELASQRAQVALTAAEAYFDAVLADRLVAIAESSLAQTESVFRQTSLARQVGNQSEFDMLRAQVSRDNQRPQVIQARTGRDVAYLRLKQLLNISYNDSVSLTTPLADDSALVRLTAQELVGSDDAAPDTSADRRAPVRELVESLRAQQAERTIARAQWLPQLTLSTQYGRIAFPSGGLPAWGDFLNNWTVTVGASFPLFTGGRIKGDRMVAEAGVREAQARLDQTRELASLDARQALAQLEQAEAALSASIGTAEQAVRAYTIADVRYREGISTQIELNDSRLLLEQASWNRATAVRDLRVARMRIALLPNLPLGMGSSTGAVGGAGTGAGFSVPQSTVPAAPRAATPQNAVQRAAAAASASAAIPPDFD